MSMRSRVASVVVLTFVIAVSSAAARHGVGHAPPFIVNSTLDGKNVLPHRIRWRARSKLPASQVAKMEFLIDGKLRWIEQNPPYTYGDDSNWLVTSWLAPGRHRFTVRGRATDGRVAQRTTIARVLPTAPPPTELGGNWKRTVTQEQAGANTPAGTWGLTVNKVGWRIRDPRGCCNLIDVAYLSGGRLQARGGIWTMPHSDREGNGWCGETNAPVNYRWAVSANKLTLTLVGSDRCGPPDAKQHFIWAGTWTRSG